MKHLYFFQKINKNRFFFIYIFLILSIKLYLLYFNPKPIEATTVSWSWFDFYNAKQFKLNPSSFTDPGHPGTPIYYLYTIILSVFGDKIENFKNFQNINHFLYILIYFFSFQYFYKYFKKKINYIYIISFYFLLFGYQISFVLLEVVSNSVFLTPLTLILIVQSFKLKQFMNVSRILKFTFTLAFALSTKFSLLPFVLTCYLAVTFEILKAQAIKKIFILNFLLLFFFIILNFPIIGRLPLSIINIFFGRADTILDFKNLIESLFFSIKILVNENLLFLIMITISAILGILFSLKKIFENKKNYFFIIFLFFSTFFFIYTLIIGGQQTKAYYAYTFLRDIDQDILLRNNQPYIIFIFFLFYEMKNYKIFSTKLILILSIAVFAITFNHYIEYRKITILQNQTYSEELKNKLNKYININEDYFAYWSTYKKYGVGEEIIHFKGNYIWANEKFNEEIINYFKNIRLLRMNDISIKIQEKVKFNNDISQNNNEYLKLWLKNKMIYPYENFIKKRFNTFFYNSLSTQSFKNLSKFLGDKNRSDEIYTGQNSYPLKLKLIAFTFPKEPKIEFQEKFDLIIDYINKSIKIKKIVTENVFKDKWFFLLIEN